MDYRMRFNLDRVIVLMSCMLLISVSMCNAAFNIKTGSEVIPDRNYTALFGKRVGLITNQSAVIGEK